MEVTIHFGEFYCVSTFADTFYVALCECDIELNEYDLMYPKDCARELAVFLPFHYDDVISVQRIIGYGLRHNGTWSLYDDITEAIEAMEDYT